MMRKLAELSKGHGLAHKIDFTSGLLYMVGTGLNCYVCTYLLASRFSKKSVQKSIPENYFSYTNIIILPCYCNYSAVPYFSPAEVCNDM